MWLFVMITMIMIYHRNIDCNYDCNDSVIMMKIILIRENLKPQNCIKVDLFQLTTPC